MLLCLPFVDCYFASPNAEYCYQRSLSVSPLAYLKNHSPKFTKFSTHVSCDVDSGDRLRQETMCYGGPDPHNKGHYGGQTLTLPAGKSESVKSAIRIADITNCK